LQSFKVANPDSYREQSYKVDAFGYFTFLLKVQSPSPDSSGNPFYFFFKNKKIETDSGNSFKELTKV